ISTGPPFDGTTYDAIGLARYDCDFDQLLEFSKADFITRPWYKYRANNTSNAMTYRKVSSHWQEDIVTYNTRPSVDSTGTISVAQQPTSGTSTARDTVNILDFIEYWQANPTQNYGMEMSISDLNQAGGAHRQYYDFNFGLASGPLLKLSFTVKEQVVTSFNDPTNLGEITVNAPAGDLPYKYLIGYEPLPVLDTLWNVVKDSIPVDSATFYKGNIQSQNFTFSKLPAERYYIGVYDNNGTRILTKEVELRQDIAVYDSTNIEVDNDTLKVAGQATSAQATLFAELPYKENGGIEFEIVSLDDDLIVGFDNSDDAFPTSESDYIYLIEVQTNGKLYFKNDSTIIDSTTVQIGDRVRMVVEDDVVYALKNRSRIGQEDSRSRITKNLKINVELKGKDSKFFVNHLFDHFKIPKFYINPIYPECEAELGQISVGKPAGTYFHSTLTSYTVKDENGNLVESGTSPFTFPVIVDDLGAGIYTVTYFYSIGTIPYTTETYISEEIVIGYPVMWTWTDPEDNITEEVGTMNTIYPTDLADPAYAVSLNKSNPGNNVTDWVQFEPKGFSMIFEVKPYSSTLPAIERIRFSNQEDEKVNEIQITDFGTSLLSRYVVVRDENDVIVSTFYGYGSLPFRVSFSDFDEDLSYDNVSVYYNDELETSYAVSPEVEGGQKVRVEMANDASIENTIASFCGEENIPAYADLTKKLDGGYYEAQKGIVRFIYQEEYNDLDGELSYNIYDALNQPIDLSSLDPELSAYGDNRYDLDFSSATGEITLDYGFYILEVQNEKNEKWYLRFRVVN
ncbi:MAG: hypothetical protein MI810_22105, partial [Flavobacteriales bacterium]|nr:hypothetical protein [Flavobacteriales bacterium]